ncbi:MAG: XdhC family protein [Clostridium fessum]
MIVYRDGRILGSIGGGCSEAAVLGEARSLIGSGRYKVVHVDLTGEAAEDEGNGLRRHYGCAGGRLCHGSGTV